MTKTERIKKMLDAQRAEREAQEAAQPTPKPETKLDPYYGYSKGKGGEMAVDRIIEDPGQPRKEFNADEMARLTASVKKYGVLQSIRIWWSVEHEKWIVRVGARRLRAAKAAGLPKVPVIIVDSDANRRQEQLIENCLRDDLKPWEQAEAFRDMMEENEWTQQQLADELHLSQGSVSRAMQLLRLPDGMQANIIAGKIPADVAVEIGKLDDPAEQEEVASKVVNEGMSRTEARNEVKAKKSSKGKGKPASKLPKAVKIKTRIGSVTVASKRGMTDDDVDDSLQEALDTRRSKRAAA